MKSSRNGGAHWKKKNGCYAQSAITRIKVRPDTVLENFPLFCPKCKQETIISVTGQNVVAVKKSENAI